jgi:hypothetical protein
MHPASLCAAGRELQQGRQAAKMARAHQHTTNHEEDEALATAAAEAAVQDATVQHATTYDAAAQDDTATLQAVAVVAACPSSQFEWPAGSGYCWFKRDSGKQQTGPGSNVFAAGNVAVNTQDQLVLTISNPNSK